MGWINRLLNGGGSTNEVQQDPEYILIRKDSLGKTRQELAVDAQDHLYRDSRIKTIQVLNDLGVPFVTEREIKWYAEALKLLIGDSFLDYCANLVNDYHAGDTKLTKLLLRGAIRASYSSKSALLHFACTGATGSGKNDLVSNVMAILPTKHVVMYSSITPKVLYYAMRVPVAGTKEMVTNPDHYRNKIICVTEIADSKGFDALKAFAEVDEYSEFTHSATIGGKGADLTVRGPRSLVITSVTGVMGKKVETDQVNRRFIQSEIEAETKQKQREKVDVVTSALVNQSSISNDPRLQVAKAGYILLFASGAAPEPPAQEVVEMIADLNLVLERKGCSMTQLKQVYALMECGAVERQCQRGYIRVEKQDVIEGWWLSGFHTDQDALLNGEWVKARCCGANVSM